MKGKRLALEIKLEDYFIKLERNKSLGQDGKKRLTQRYLKKNQHKP